MRWLAEYPPAVPHHIELPPNETLLDEFDRNLKSYADREAAACMGSRLTYRELDGLSESLAAWLQGCGLERGSRVALMMPNVPQYLVAMVGVLRAGFVVVNVNPLYTARELEHQLNDSGATAIIALENFADTVGQVVDRTLLREVVLTGLGDLLGFWKGRVVNFAVRHLKQLVPAFEFRLNDGLHVSSFLEVLDAGSRKVYRRPSLSPDDLAFLQYTGGTTGVSKGAVLRHRNLLANLAQTHAWFQPTLAELGDRRLTVLCALPLYHIFALTVCALVGLRLGARLLLIPNPRDVGSMVSAIARHPVNMLPAVNTLFNALLEDPDFRRLDFSGLRVAMGGGMAVQQATAERWLALTGCPITEGYGLSETSPVATSNRLDARRFSGTIGLPLPSTDVEIRDDVGRAVAMGQAGEIVIRGPQVMSGYWNRPDETAQVMTSDGFFRTGDIGTMDEKGYVRIVDRKKDMILVSGFNVYPNEIEQVVSQHPGVLECAAVGVADARSGEAVKLFVVRRDGGLMEDDIAAFCRENLTAYKCPRHIEFRDELPKSNVGKVLRRELRSST